MGWFGGIRPRNDNVVAGPDDLRESAGSHARTLRYIDRHRRRPIHCEPTHLKPRTLGGPFDPADNSITIRHAENLDASGRIPAIDANLLPESLPGVRGHHQ